MRVSVVMPVGPHPANQRWIDEAVASIDAQTHDSIELVVVDDMANFSPHMVPPSLTTTIWRAPWYLGVAHAFNIGVSVAQSELVFMLGSDDWLEPTCIEECVKEYESIGDPMGYYHVGVRYTDTLELQDVACHAAMVTKTLWRITGGFPIASASGAPDAAFISILLGNYPRAGRLRKVADGKPLYNYRRHHETDTASKGAWQGVILETRDLVTREWRSRV